MWKRQDRNCRKHLPLKHSNSYKWTPEFHTEKGTPYTIDVECEDCPRSLVDDAAMALVSLVRQDRHAKDATGATLYGPVRGKWPSAWDDAVQIAERVRIMEHNAEIEAFARDPKN